MRRYETIIITDPDLSAEKRAPVFERIEDVINQKDGYLAFTDEWGIRKLAYEIKKKERGYYVRFDFCGTGAVVDEMERFFRIDDRILKYMTVMIDESADIEKIKEEVAEAQSKLDASRKQEEAAETRAPEEQAEGVETPKPAEPVEPAEAREPGEQAEPAEAEKKEDPTPDEAQQLEAESDRTETAPSETGEENK